MVKVEFWNVLFTEVPHMDGIVFNDLQEKHGPVISIDGISPAFWEATEQEIEGYRKRMEALKKPDIYIPPCLGVYTNNHPEISLKYDLKCMQSGYIR